MYVGMSKKFVPWVSADKTRNEEETNIRNGYLLPAGTSIFDIRMLMERVRVS